MTSSMPGAAIPGPDDVPEWEEQDAHQQPDPFGKETDEDGGTGSTDDDDTHREDPRAQ